MAWTKRAGPQEDRPQGEPTMLANRNSANGYDLKLNGRVKEVQFPEITSADLEEHRPIGTDEISIGKVMVGGEEGCTIEDAAKLIGGVKYLVRDWIPFTMVTALVAEPGMCKSAFALWLARTIVTAGDWFNGSKGPPKPRRVLWCPTENDTAVTIQRMTDWDIPGDKFRLPFKDDPLRSIDLTHAGHLELMEALIEKHRPLAVIVDSLRG